MRHIRSHRPRSLFAFASTATIAAVMAVAPTATAHAAAPLPVEARFQQAGAATVTRTTVTDAEGQSYTLHYPANLADDGFANPIITWGNGTGANCAIYQWLFDRLASWGFAVICADSGATGWGTQIWAGARYLIAENARPGSVFQGRLDTAAIGASGHSQGATGALNANILAHGAITSTAPLAFVDPWWHNPATQQPDLAKVKNPVFLFSGANDFVTLTQPAYLDQLPTPKGRAAAKNQGHLSMPFAGIPYVTAWFMYTLRGDAQARSAFVATGGVAPEIGRNTAWTGWTAAGLA